MEKKYFIGGNWKCNGNKESSIKLYNQIQSSNIETVVFPPSIYIPILADQKKSSSSSIKLGAQNAFDKEGAFTGELSCAMLKEMDLEYVIVGHSERRTLFLESDEAVAQRAAGVLKAGLSLVYCIGESLEERESGQTTTVIAKQMSFVLGSCGKASAAQLVLAYEPKWAIGTGKNASPEQAQEVHAQIREILTTALGAEHASAIRIIYGGSVKPANSDSLIIQKDIDGFLIGGASLIAADFNAITNSFLLKRSKL